MNFSFLLLAFLKKKGSVSLANFGTFYLKNTNATLDKTGTNILPPGKEVMFNTNTEGNDKDFVEFLAIQNSSSSLEAEIEITKQINYWNITLERNSEVTIENLGTIFLDDHQVFFTANQTENISADSYGLEEINISEIKKNPKEFKNSYPFIKSIYRVIPLVIGVLALTYFGITQPEKIFGKKSFDKNLPEKPTDKIGKTPTKVVSAQLKNSNVDSLRNDSIKPIIITKTAPVKKWRPKKYSKSKWKNPKKRPNH